MLSLVDECSCHVSAAHFSCCPQQDHTEDGNPRRVRDMTVLGSNTVAMLMESQLQDYKQVFIYESAYLEHMDVLFFGDNGTDIVFLNDPPLWIQRIVPPQTMLVTSTPRRSSRRRRADTVVSNASSTTNHIETKGHEETDAGMYTEIPAQELKESVTGIHMKGVNLTLPLSKGDPV